MITTLKAAPRSAAMTVAALIVAFGFSACNTIEGAGQDIKSTGKAIEKTADDNK
jgi:predicted small secreted protein